MSDKTETLGPREAKTRQYRAAAEQVGRQVTFAVDTDGRIRLWDRGAERVLGFKASAALGRRCCDTICRSFGSRAGTCTTHGGLAQRALRGGLPPTVTLDVATSEGQLVTLTAEPSVVQLDTGTDRLAVLHKVIGVSELWRR